jgi:hypothetical protein
VEQSQIVELAHAIASQSVVDAWPYWLLLLLLGFLVSVGGGFLGSYAAKRGEVEAARADQREILEQLRATTRAAEEAKSAVSFGEWTERERRSLRRTKLEEMMMLAYDTRHWQSREMDRIYDDNLPEQPSPQVKAMVLGKLYFPELRAKLHAYDRACDVYGQILGQTRIKCMTARARYGAVSLQAQAEVTRIVESDQAEILTKQSEAYQLLLELESAAEVVMAELIAPPPSQLRGD